MYWHGQNKDNLVRSAADSAWAEIALPELTMGWRAAAETMATGMYESLRARIESATGTGYNESPDTSFAFGLTTLLDGLHRRLTTE